MTSQINDIIEYNENCYLLDGNGYILDAYLDSRGFTSNDLAHARGLTFSISSACRRGYVAIWKIENDQLFYMTFAIHLY